MSFEIAYLAACALLVLVGPYMIFAACYEDGIVGKVAMGAVWFAASAVVINACVDARLPAVPPQSAWIITGLTVFMLRHLRRFWKFRYHQRNPK